MRYSTDHAVLLAKLGRFLSLMEPKHIEEKDEDNAEKEENDEVNSQSEENSFEGNDAFDVENIATDLEEPIIQSSALNHVEHNADVMRNIGSDSHCPFSSSPFDNSQAKESCKESLSSSKPPGFEGNELSRFIEIAKTLGYDMKGSKQERNSLLTRIRDIDRLDLQDVAQKAKLKWAIEGDENSKYFHGILKKKRRQIEVLDHDLNRDEVKEAVWACGTDKSYGPDGFTFSNLKRFWDILQDDVYGYIDEFFHSSDIPIGCNSPFITLIPKIANPVDIKDYRPINLIGLQYKILSKLLANGLAKDYLQKKLEYLGFSQLWRDRIHACLTSSRSSILVNRSPTNEFHIKRGLRQGDPLSPFIFIIAMEGLHVAIEDDLAAGYRGIQINLRKSNIFGIGLSAEITSQFALLTGCTSASLLFSYLDIPVKWNSVLSSRNKGGLDIGSLEAFNKALLYKWKWRLCIERNALWVKIIKSVHRDYVGFITNRASDFKQKGVGRTIVRTINNVHDKNIIPANSISKRVGDRMSTKLATRSNFDSRGIDVPSTLFPIYDSHVETIDHIIIACLVALDIYAFVYRLCDLIPPSVHYIPDLVHWMEHVHLTGS
nr:RNA-directed DNA polymerase, eukaryota, reverse transcriptase zinc-binding domain protein [Tanacetum cinerariifolium]